MNRGPNLSKQGFHPNTALIRPNHSTHWLLVLFVAVMALIGCSRKFDFYQDATPIPAILKQKVGSTVRVFAITIYQNMVEVTIQDPSDHSSTLDLLIRDGKLVPQSGVPASARGIRNEAELSKMVTDINSINFQAIASMAKVALEQAKWENMKINYFIRRGNDGWWAYMEDPRKKRQVVSFFPDGRMNSNNEMND